jgi:sphingomyelin phosphodiesterase
LKFVFISDLHIDYDYVVGADNDCGKPLCCRSDSGIAPSEERSAGKWGDYSCDLNVNTLNSLLSHIKDEIKPDFVLWAGDSIPHNLDSLTFDSNV